MSTGYCIDCADGTLRRDAVLIRVIEQGSGPGAGVYACPDHARAHATAPGAPDRLRGDVAGFDGPDQEAL